MNTYTFSRVKKLKYGLLCCHHNYTSFSIQYNFRFLTESAGPCELPLCLSILLAGWGELSPESGLGTGEYWTSRCTWRASGLLVTRYLISLLKNFSTVWKIKDKTKFFCFRNLNTSNNQKEQHIAIPFERNFINLQMTPLALNSQPF